jgi:LmbE family N-acetylglucosaminyl deacetylase
MTDRDVPIADRGLFPRDWIADLPRRSRRFFGVLREKTLDELREAHQTVVLKYLLWFGSELMEAGPKSALVIAPHQDDETFGCGGLIALKREMNVPVKVVFLTDGSGSHRHIAELDPHALTEQRQAEAHAAGAILGLGPSDLLFLDLPDSRLRTMSPSEREKAISRLIAIMQDFQPGEVYVTHRHDKHEDHEAGYEIVAEAVERSGMPISVLQYMIWGIWWSALGSRLTRDDFAGARRLPIGSAHGKKHRAIGTYRSQVDVLPSGFLKRFFWPYEIFFRTPSRT